VVGAAHLAGRVRPSRNIIGAPADGSLDPPAPLRLRQALHTIDTYIDDYIGQSRVAALAQESRTPRQRTAGSLTGNGAANRSAAGAARHVSKSVNRRVKRLGDMAATRDRWRAWSRKAPM
jgi:hypothetical protein